MESIIDLTITIMSFGIVGALVSSFINVFKDNLSKSKRKLLTVVISLIFGALIAWLYKTEYVQTVLFVLGSASTIYGFILKDEKRN